MNRRTFLAALGIAPAVAVAKPEPSTEELALAGGYGTMEPEPMRFYGSPLLPHQRELVSATEHEVLLCGGFCSGKTHGVVAWCRDTPGDKIVALPSDFAFRPFYEKAGWMGGCFTRNDATITFENGVRVRLIHPGTPPDSLRGLGIRKIAFDGTGADEFESLWCNTMTSEPYPTNALAFEQMVFSVRPTSSSAYLYRRFHENPTPSRRVISCNVADNSHVSAEYRNTLLSVDPRYISGEWA